MCDKLKAIPVKSISNFKIYKTRNKNYERQYIIWNTNFTFKNGHTHRFTLGECESIIQNLLNSTLPSRKCAWKKYNDILVSYIRLSDSDEYTNKLINILNDRKLLKK